MAFAATRQTVCTTCHGAVRKGDFINWSRAQGAWHVICDAPAGRPNERAGRCEICRGAVAKLQGVLAPITDGDGYRIRCRSHADTNAERPPRSESSPDPSGET